jgi:hypothetical protein
VTKKTPDTQCRYVCDIDRLEQKVDKFMPELQQERASKRLCSSFILLLVSSFLTFGCAKAPQEEVQARISGTTAEFAGTTIYHREDGKALYRFQRGNTVHGEVGEWRAFEGEVCYTLRHMRRDLASLENGCRLIWAADDDEVFWTHTQGDSSNLHAALGVRTVQEEQAYQRQLSEQRRIAAKQRAETAELRRKAQAQAAAQRAAASRRAPRAATPTHPTPPGWAPDHFAHCVGFCRGEAEYVFNSPGRRGVYGQSAESEFYSCMNICKSTPYYRY